MSQRIVSIQHGDYRESLEIVASNAPEPYFGMKYSVASLERLFEGGDSLVISLDSPAYAERRGHRELAGMPVQKLPRPLPRRIAEYFLARRILKKIEEFRPTHVLIRTGMPILVSELLRFCRKRREDTLVVFANTLDNSTPRSLRTNQKTTALLNEPFVFRVGNHRWPATQSLIDAGLDPAKAVVWDTPGRPEAKDYPVKDLPDPPFSIVYAGSVFIDKGVGDLIDAASILHAEGLRFRLILVGNGEDLPALEQKARSLPEGLVEFKGRRPNSEVFQWMKEAALVVIPSRHSFPEGLPYTITEGLASRTPLIVSDHPVMTRGFRDHEGLRFFRASDPASLASVARSVLENPQEYRHLSETTADALERVDCKFSFGDLLDQWKQTFPKPA